MPGFFRKIRGPRLGTKLAIMGLALLIIPWFSYRQLVEMERLLIQGQSQAQLLTAEGFEKQKQAGRRRASRGTVVWQSPRWSLHHTLRCSGPGRQAPGNSS